MTEKENRFQNGVLISVDEEISTRFTVSSIMCDAPAKSFVKVSKGAKIRNRYNQVPHLTQDTNGKVTNSQ